MKKIIILAVFTLMGMNALRGQSKAEPSAKIAAKFSQEFKGATNVSWEKVSGLSVAQFQFEQNHTIAYFDNEGNLVAQGRRIKEDQLPLKLHASLLAMKDDREKKSGTLTIGNIFEYVGESDYTQYVTSLENGTESIVVGTVNGKLTVRSKVRKAPGIPGAPKDVIAKIK